MACRLPFMPSLSPVFSLEIACLVQGSGPVGLSVAALAMLSGAGWVGVLGAPAQRLETAKRMGADWTCDVFETTPEERKRKVLDATGGTRRET